MNDHATTATKTQSQLRCYLNLVDRLSARTSSWGPVMEAAAFASRCPPEDPALALQLFDPLVFGGRDAGTSIAVNWSLPHSAAKHLCPLADLRANPGMSETDVP
jgi:hypothetical protein